MPVNNYERNSTEMAQERQIKQLKTIYTAIAKKLVDPSFKFSEGGATKKTLSNFIDRMSKEFGSVSEQRLVDICVYIAYIYRDSNLPVKSIFGQSSFQRFLTSKRGQRYYENEWLLTKELNRDTLLSLIVDKRQHPLAEYIYMPSEEDRKTRLHNQRAGYVACQTSTLGWSPLSDACKECCFISECKEETNRKYPELYRIRIEHGNGTN